MSEDRGRAPDALQLDLVLRPERRPIDPVRAETEPPFFRPQQRTRVGRPRRGPRRAVLALNIAGLLLFGSCGMWRGYSKVMASERLKVTRVEVRGGQFLSEGEVRELLGPAVGENILTLDIDSLKQRLRASPWVQDAHVQRNLPDTLRVEIEERRPVALAEIDRLYLMDAAGVLIEIYGPRTASFDLPIVRGLGGLGLAEREERARRVGALLLDLDELAAELSEVRADRAGELEAVLKGGEVARLGGPPYRKKFMTFLGLRAGLRQRCPSAEFFDLRFRDRIVVKERESALGGT